MYTVKIANAAARRLSAKSSFLRDVRIENEAGFWAILKFDPQGGSHGYGVYYVEAYAPYFPADMDKFTVVSNQHRHIAERHMRTWLKTFN